MLPKDSFLATVADGQPHGIWANCLLGDLESWVWKNFYTLCCWDLHYLSCVKREKFAFFSVLSQSADPDLTVLRNKTLPYF